jgi:hypothetical protein
MKRPDKHVIYDVTESARDREDSSRVLFSNLRLIDGMRFELLLVLQPSKSRARTRQAAARSDRHALLRGRRQARACRLRRDQR